MNPKHYSILHLTLTILIGLVWFINGLICKVLGLVPRHEAIVSRILGDTYASEITIAIGLGEVALAIWIWSRLFSRVHTWLQIALVATMNVLEFFIAADLLLWQKWNAVHAAAFILLVFANEYIVKKKAAAR